MKDPNRPMGCFVFLGPSGVGKTLLAKALAEFLFNDESALVQLDMSEFMEPGYVGYEEGGPPGYVGYDEGGQLTRFIADGREPFGERHNRYSLLSERSATKSSSRVDFTGGHGPRRLII
jgi:ATP-dependent Clp protease ATP-binding subunit ClpA